MDATQKVMSRAARRIITNTSCFGRDGMASIEDRLFACKHTRYRRRTNDLFPNQGFTEYLANHALKGPVGKLP